MLIFGGDYERPYGNQISVLEDCRLKRIGSLPTAFIIGACNTYQRSDGISETLLCFGLYRESECQRFQICFK